MKLGRRLIARFAPLLVLAGVARVWLEPRVLALSETSRRASLANAVVLFPAFALAVLVFGAVVLRRTGPAGSTQAAIAAHRLPRQFALGVGAIGLATAAVDLLWQLWRGTLPSVAVPMALFVVAAVALLGLATYVAVWRAALPGLAAIPPNLLPERRATVRARLVLAIAVPVACTAIVATLLVFRHADEAARESDRVRAAEVATFGVTVHDAPPPPVRPWALAVALLAATLVAAALGGGAGHRAARDLSETARSVDRLASSKRGRGPTYLPVFVELARLTEAVDALSRRYEEIEATDGDALDAREQAQRMKTQFLASMSHDLRSPLNSIIGFSELLLRGVEGPLPAPQRENVEIIKRSGEDLLRLINDILDSARIEAGRIDLVRRWTPSVALVTDTIRRARELIGDKPVDLHSELQPGLPPIYVDVDRLAQALFNLLSNAVKFMSTGTIWVRAHVAQGPPGPDGHYLRVEVADTGQGIPAEHRESIFEAFRQLDGGSTRRAGGMGLGLSLAKSLVELHGGRIWLESRMGEGSVFYVAVPLSED